MMYLFKKTVFNCKQATLLSLKKEERKLSFFESMKLAYHLLYCQPCKKFIQQSRLINRVGEEVSQSLSNRPPFRLSEETKQRMQRELDLLSN